MKRARLIQARKNLARIQSLQVGLDAGEGEGVGDDRFVELPVIHRSPQGIRVLLPDRHQGSGPG